MNVKILFCRRIVSVAYLIICLFITASCDEKSLQSTTEVDTAVIDKPIYTKNVKNDKFLDEVSFASYVTSPGSGLVEQVILGSNNVRLQYLPVNFLALQELDGEAYSKTKFDSIRESYGDYHYMLLEIVNRGNNHNGDILQYFSRFHQIPHDQLYTHFSLNAQNNFKLQEGSRERTCSVYNLEYIQGISPKLKFMLGFEADTLDTTKDLILVINDKILGIENESITISGEQLSNLPQLKHSL